MMVPKRTKCEVMMNEPLAGFQVTDDEFMSIFNGLF
jgi:hypothetical protein